MPIEARLWLDRFFRSYYALRPVNATFVGVHDYDHRWPDHSPNGMGDAVAEMEALREARPQAGEDGWTDLDVCLARGFLDTQLWEYGSRHFQLGNPSTYTGEAAFGLMGLFLTPFAPLSQRMGAAVARLEALPAFLDQAEAQVREAPPAWTQRAIRECRGILSFLAEGLPLLVDEGDLAAQGLPRSAQRAAAAVAEYRDHLQSTLSHRVSHHYACGEEALDRYLRRGHFVTTGLDDLVAYARDELSRAEGSLTADARRLGASAPEDVLAALADVHPPVERYYDRYREQWLRIRRLAETEDLLTWPDFPIRFVPRPAWCRAAAPDLYFLFYRSPAAFGRPAVHDYLVTPVEPDMDPGEQRARLRATNDSVILLNHVVHHGGLGHHVQNWHAFRSRSRVGQVAAVDCASRIAMFCGGTMAEGWACYATDLVREVGGLTEGEALAETASRRRMCARAVVDVQLHRGAMTLDDGAEFYVRRAGMTPPAAWAEVVKNSMFPGAACMYLLGTDAIHALRREMSALAGARFSLRAFHDELLSFGSIPVALAVDEMRKRRTSGPGVARASSE